MHDVDATPLSADLWSVLLRWISHTLYVRCTTMGLNIEGDGLELRRRPSYTEFAGGDGLVRLAG